jgi:hypothetical protein
MDEVYHPSISIGIVPYKVNVSNNANQFLPIGGLADVGE